MTNQEAIEEIKRWTTTLMQMGSLCVNDTAEAQKMAILALEKQIPKKIIKVKPYGSKCPVCDCYFDSRAWKSAYCGKCGQKIDWRD